MFKFCFVEPDAEGTELGTNINNIVQNKNGSIVNGIDSVSEGDILDLSDVSPILIFEQYVNSSVANILLENSMKDSKNNSTGKMDKNDRNSTGKKDYNDLIFNVNTISSEAYGINSHSKNNISDSNNLNNSNSFNNENEEKKLQSAILYEGKLVLEKLLNSNTINGSDSVMSESRANSNQIFELNLHTVTLQNFGPYGGDKVNYPLEKR